MTVWAENTLPEISGQTQACAFACSSGGSKVVGYAKVGGISVPVLWSSGTASRLTVPTEYASGDCEATMISDDGSVIGGFVFVNHYYAPCLWSGADWSFSLIQVPGESVTTAWLAGLSADGSIKLIEHEPDGGQPNELWIDNGGTWTSIPIPSGLTLLVQDTPEYRSVAMSSDGSKIIATFNSSVTYYYVPYVYSGGAWSELSLLDGGKGGSVGNISKDGTAITGALFASTYEPFFALWNGESATTFGIGGSAQTFHNISPCNSDGSIIAFNQSTNIPMIYRGGESSALPISGASSTAWGISGSGSLVVGLDSIYAVSWSPISSAYLADTSFKGGAAIDLSVEASRRRFISASGGAVNPGSDGSSAFGAKATVLFSATGGGQADTADGYATNAGNGGDFTLDNGPLTLAPSSPPGTVSTTLPKPNVIGDYRNGNLYYFDLDEGTDAGVQRRWLRTWRALPQPSGQPNRFDSLTVNTETGMDTPDGTAPLLALRWSDDGGHTWSSRRLMAAGPPGAVAQRVKFNRLGSTRLARGLDRIFELSSTDDTKIAITDAEVEP